MQKDGLSAVRCEIRGGGRDVSLPHGTFLNFGTRLVTVSPEQEYHIFYSYLKSGVLLKLARIPGTCRTSPWPRLGLSQLRYPSAHSRISS
jgi:hypothetical protein